MKSDYVDLRDFTSPTAAAIRDYYQEQGWEELDNLVSPESAALMFFRLRKAPDEIFYNGKWATIQRLEQLIEKTL